MEAAEEAAELKVKSNNMFGFMTKGKKDNFIRDNQVNDLAQVREHSMAQESIGQVSRKIEERFRTLGDPRQIPAALREAIALGETNRPPGEYRLDADDPQAIVPSFSHACK